MDITPGLNPMAEIRFMEVMVGAQRQFVLFNGPGNSPVVAMQDDGSAKADSATRRLVPPKRASNETGIRDWGLGLNRSGNVAANAADRAGYALVLFLMMVFGLMGLAALVIDMGFARLAQRQMQTAVDSAALEGLRWRDVDATGDLPQGWLADPDFLAQTGVSGTVTSMSPQQWRRFAAGLQATWWPTSLTTTLIRPTAIRASTVRGRWWISPAASVRRNSPHRKPCRLASRRFTNQSVRTARLGWN